MKLIRESSENIIRSVRAIESPIEFTLFNEMQRSAKFVLCRENDDPAGEGYFVFPQQPVGSYRADFIIKGVGYLPMSRVWPPKLSTTIAVECDGKEFHSTPEQIKYDKDREEYFENMGIKTIRLSGSAINKNPALCVQEIINFIHREMAHG